ncbi:unnamed protein product [Effrenium voratum]|nr:unnamed protein product [Effrenium voratum]
MAPTIRKGFGTQPPRSLEIVHEDLSGESTLVPRRLLRGKLPDALLEPYEFWRGRRVVGKLKQEHRCGAGTAVVLELTEDQARVQRVCLESNRKDEEKQLDQLLHAPSLAPKGDTLTLVDLLRANAKSETWAVAEWLLQLEDLSHILAWAQVANSAGAMSRVELPRLGLSFTGEKGQMRCDQHGGLKVVGQRSFHNEPGLRRLVKPFQRFVLLEAGLARAEAISPEEAEEPMTHWKTYDFFEDEDSRAPSAGTWAGSEDPELAGHQTGASTPEWQAPWIESEGSEDEVTQMLTWDPFEPVLAKAAKAPCSLVPFPMAEETPPPCPPQQLRWRLDRLESRKLQSSEKQVLSPLFHLELPSSRTAPFRIMILAKETRGKGQRGFAKAKGAGRIFLKCLSSEAVPRLRARISVTGAETECRECRGPFLHHFNESSCCPLQGPKEQWDLKEMLEVQVELEFC